MKLLFTNAGRRTYLIDYALDLVENGYDLDIYVSDASQNAAAMHVSEKVKTFITPRVTDDESRYARVLLQFCEEKGIDVVIPLMDYEIPILGHWRERFLNSGTRVWVSKEETAEVCLNKRQTYMFCRANGFRMPRSWFSEMPHDEDLPVIYKRVCGSGSVGQRLIERPSQLLGNDDVYFYQEYIEGQEVGIDILNDYDGNYVHSYYREKLLMRGGETDKARTFASERLDELARRLSGSLRHTGNLDLDIIVTEQDDVYLIDLNPRFGGGYPFTHQSGFNYIRAILDMSGAKTPSLSGNGRSIIGMKGLALHYYRG